MANELHAYSSSGLTLYAVLLDTTGQAWNSTAFEALAGANWTTYALPLAEAAAGVYLGALPAVGAGEYNYVVYEQVDAAPATTDKLRGVGSVLWDGANVPLPALEATAQGIKTKTDNLPADPASASDIPGAAPTPAQIFGWINPDTGIAASDYLGGIPALQTSANLIKAKTDNLPTSPAATGDIPSAAAIKSALEANGSKIDHIWELTEDDGGIRRLSANALEQAPVVTPQAVRDAMKLAPSAGAAAAGSVDAHLDDMAATPAPTPAEIFDWINPDTGISAAEYLTGIGALQSSASLIQARVDEILADTGTDIPALIAAGNEAVAGAVRYTYTLTSSVDGAPITGADVWLTSDEAGDLAVASGRTDVQGQVRFYVDPGTYYLWRQLAGWVFTNPTTVVVPGA